MILLENASATGLPAMWGGGQGVFSAVATFGGATVSLQSLLPDGTTWGNVSSATALTAAGFATFILPPGQIRAAVTGGAPSAIYAAANQAHS